MGLYISSKYPFLGASVDGIITCSKCGVGTLEIKCPYGKKSDNWRNKHPLECASNKSFCAQIDEKKKTLILKTDHNIYIHVWKHVLFLNLVSHTLEMFTYRTYNCCIYMYICRSWRNQKHFNDLQHKSKHTNWTCTCMHIHVKIQLKVHVKCFN